MICRTPSYRKLCDRPRVSSNPSYENTPKNNQSNIYNDYALFARSGVAVGVSTSRTVYQWLRRGQRSALSRPIRIGPGSDRLRRYPGLTQFRCNGPRNIGRKWSGSAAPHLASYLCINRSSTAWILHNRRHSGLCTRGHRSERVPRKRCATDRFRHGNLR